MRAVRSAATPARRIEKPRLLGTKVFLQLRRRLPE